jgi:heptosyltransferase-1
MSRILLIKTSSLGDVVHNLPVVSDIRQHLPNAQIDWVVEQSFADIPALHSAVNAVHTVALRQWRKRWWQTATWQAIAASRRAIQQTRYDHVIDTQGLIKSGLLGLWSHGLRSGFDAASARESLASHCYQQCFCVSRQLHAISRNRELAGLVLGYQPQGLPDYGLTPTPLPECQPYAVLLHATSRADKQWPDAHWLQLGQYLQQQGLGLVLPWGSPSEQQKSQQLAQQLGGAAQGVTVPERLNLRAAAALLAGAHMVIGVDTGLSHLAVALGRPTIALFCASDPDKTGVWGASKHANLGLRLQAPAPSAVIHQLTDWGLCQG